MKTEGRRAAILTIGATVAVVGFVLLVLWHYRFRPTLGAPFLVLGWMSLLATGYFLAKAARIDFSRTEVTEDSLNEERRAELMREKRLLLKAIKEAEFDRDLKKLDETEADGIILRYRARAVDILRLLEPEKETGGQDYASLVEEELHKRLAAGPRACLDCGKVNDEDAAFCKGCGAKITA
jgi:PAS domain-containing protein